MTQNSHFDYIIIGNGLAGLQLALRFASDSFFDDKQIALIDPSEKVTNDKTWSFWETEPSIWNAFVHRSWKHAEVITNTKTIALALSPYTYKTIRAIDFYSGIKAQLKSKTNIHFIIDRIVSVTENEQVIVSSKQNRYTATHVFDSRIPDKLPVAAKHNISIVQHFKGWVIQTEQEVFNPDKIIMMDYRLKDGDQTTFTYVLPFSKTEALVEFTYFTENSVPENTYDRFIKTYIKDFLNLDQYRVLETEIGQIPMTNYPFERHNSSKLTKIGTAGGWVKGSTGYSFKHTEKKISKIITNIKSNKVPSYKLFRKKYKFYDKVFLKVLKDENDKGEWIFRQFYAKNDTGTMFRFLDEESSLFEEFKIMRSLLSWSFIKAFFKTL